jgi:hypothetical protein
MWYLFPPSNKNTHNTFLTNVTDYLYSQKYVTNLVHIYMLLSKYIHNSYKYIYLMNHKYSNRNISFVEQMDWIIFCAVILLMRTYTQVKFRFTALTGHTNPFAAALKLVHWAKIQIMQKIFTYYCTQ